MFSPLTPRLHSKRDVTVQITQLGLISPEPQSPCNRRHSGRGGRRSTDTFDTVDRIRREQRSKIFLLACVCVRMFCCASTRHRYGTEADAGLLACAERAVSQLVVVNIHHKILPIWPLRIVLPLADSVPDQRLFGESRQVPSTRYAPKAAGDKVTILERNVVVVKRLHNPTKASIGECRSVRPSRVSG